MWVRAEIEENHISGIDFGVKWRIWPQHFLLIFIMSVCYMKMILQVSHTVSVTRYSINYCTSAFYSYVLIL